ncbi:MAG: hypothetical protein NT009_02330 [Proteobacteria bacterium]|jgi:hypothetical protein|nr:hypothetical protein [Pseudomonadota bacterium]
MNRNCDKITEATAKGKTESPERRKFLHRFLGMGILALFFRPDLPGNLPPPPSASKKADFWRKGGRLAG